MCRSEVCEAMKYSYWVNNRSGINKEFDFGYDFNPA